MGVAAGVIPYFACTTLKQWLKYDDALDTFGIHGIGGTIGALLTGVLATATMNPHLISSITAQNGLQQALTNHLLLIIQGKAVGTTLLYAIVSSLLIALFVRGTLGLRAEQEAEAQGLDITDHGEEGYTMNG